MEKPEKKPKEKPKEKPDEPKLVLFTLAYNPTTDTITYQTNTPIPQVMNLVQTILLGQQKAAARQEVLAEIAKQAKGSEQTEKEGAK